MILAAHQPDLLPYPGFFAKMQQADLFDIAIHDQFQKKGYQRRVQMRGEWASVLVTGQRNELPIKDVQIHPETGRRLCDTIYGRYRGARNWPRFGDMVLEWVQAAESDRLWLFNLALIVRVRDWLEIETPLSIARTPVGRGVEGLIDVCAQYPNVHTYVSGLGGKAYMGDHPERDFQEAGVRLLWSKYESPTSDSILTLMMDSPEPRRILR